MCADERTIRGLYAAGTSNSIMTIFMDKILQIAQNLEKNTGIESSENKLKLTKFNNENITVK